MFVPNDFTLEDLFDAYFDCRKNKRNSLNQLLFEENLETNLLDLWHDLNSGCYQIGRSLAFVIQYPKMREIWAADFRDRIVHHLIYNKISDYYYRRFIRDSYACIPGRGIHDAKDRMSAFARSVSRNYTLPAFVLTIDIAHFFNSIQKQTLKSIIRKSLAPGWCMDLVIQSIDHDPRDNAVFRSSKALFDSVPVHKSLLKATCGQGLPIGNLTSQFYANIYLNELDQFIKHELKAKYYGRYVDDMVLMHHDSGQLNQWRREIDRYLQHNLGLYLHPNKIWLNKTEAGFDFVGFVIKPGRAYMRRSSLERCRQKIRSWEREGRPLNIDRTGPLCRSITCYLGMLRHVQGYNARRSLCGRVESLFIRSGSEFTKLEVVDES